MLFELFVEIFGEILLEFGIAGFNAFNRPSRSPVLATLAILVSEKLHKPTAGLK